MLIGFIEVGCGIALLVPPFAFYAAGVLGVVMIGATYTHLISGVPGATIPLVCLMVLAAIAYLRRPAAQEPQEPTNPKGQGSTGQQES